MCFVFFRPANDSYFLHFPFTHLTTYQFVDMRALILNNYSYFLLGVLTRIPVCFPSHIAVAVCL